MPQSNQSPASCTLESCHASLGSVCHRTMSRLLRICSLLLVATSVLTTSAFAQSSRTEGRVTQVIREVNVLESALPPRRAVLNETLGQGTAVRTGGNSRAELTFVDLTITRLGANTLYSFKLAGRQVELNGGSTLLRVPKGGGPAKIVSPVITAGITGTTVILESTRAGEGRVTVLELRTANGSILSANDNWAETSDSATLLSANGLALPNSNESGIFTVLAPGQYTAILAGKNG